MSSAEIIARPGFGSAGGACRQRFDASFRGLLASVSFGYRTGEGAEIETAVQEIQLVNLVASGDRRALAELYERYSSLMLAVGLRILHNRREAEDLLHDVFLEVWRRAGDYDRRRGTVRTWLLLRMRSRAIDRRRSARLTRQVLVDDCLQFGDEASSEDPATAPDRTAVRRALVDLPEEQRQVVVLGYFQGLSSTEIAEQVGVPVGTVKSRVAAARAKLKIALSSHHMGRG